MGFAEVEDFAGLQERVPHHRGAVRVEVEKVVLDDAEPGGDLDGQVVRGHGVASGFAVDDRHDPRGTAGSPGVTDREARAHVGQCPVEDRAGENVQMASVRSCDRILGADDHGVQEAGVVVEKVSHQREHVVCTRGEVAVRELHWRTGASSAWFHDYGDDAQFDIAVSLRPEVEQP